MKAHQLFYMDCHLAGRKFHDCDLVWSDLRIGQTLRLEREPQNPYDANAIQVIFNKDGEDYLLGYIPRSDNSQLVALLDAGWTDLFTCRISRLTPDVHPENQVQLTISIKRNRNVSDSIVEQNKESKSNNKNRKQ